MSLSRQSNTSRVHFTFRITVTALGCVNVIDARSVSILPLPARPISSNRRMRPDLLTRLPPPPRVVRRKLGSGCALWFPRIFVLPHMIIGILTLLAVPTRWYVYHHGTHVQAKIHKLERRTSKKGGDYYVVGF